MLVYFIARLPIITVIGKGELKLILSILNRIASIASWSTFIKEYGLHYG